MRGTPAHHGRFLVTLNRKTTNTAIRHNAISRVGLSSLGEGPASGKTAASEPHK